MISNYALTSDQLKDAVDAIKMNKPVYAETIDFYGRIFNAQEMSKARIQIPTLQISQEMLAVKAREKLPLIDINEFLFDKIEAARLFFAICNLVKEGNLKLAADAKTILNALDKIIKPEDLFSGLLHGEDTLYEKIADELKIDHATLGFISYNSQKGFLPVL
ncbi:MAG: hypothetical protein PVF32_03700 [Desulfobacterales bacterium]|jgi:hypothetical protein